MSAFSENLLALRKERNLNQEEAAAACGIAYRSYRRYETGEREPTLSVLLALSRFYGVTLDELAGCGGQRG